MNGLRSSRMASLLWRRDNDEVRSAVHEWLRTRPKEFFPHGIYTLVKHWRKCIELEGDYVEQ